MLFTYEVRFEAWPGSQPAIASAIRTTLNPKASACLHPGGVGTCFVLLAASRAPLLGGSVDPAVFTATDARQTVHLLRFERRPRGVYRGRRSAESSAWIFTGFQSTSSLCFSHEGALES